MESGPEVLSLIAPQNLVLVARMGSEAAGYYPEQQVRGWCRALLCGERVRAGCTAPQPAVGKPSPKNSGQKSTDPNAAIRQGANCDGVLEVRRTGSTGY